MLEDGHQVNDRVSHVVRLNAEAVVLVDKVRVQLDAGLVVVYPLEREAPRLVRRLADTDEAALALHLQDRLQIFIVHLLKIAIVTDLDQGEAELRDRFHGRLRLLRLVVVVLLADQLPLGLLQRRLSCFARVRDEFFVVLREFARLYVKAQRGTAERTHRLGAGHGDVVQLDV